MRRNQHSQPVNEELRIVDEDQVSVRERIVRQHGLESRDLDDDPADNGLDDDEARFADEEASDDGDPIPLDKLFR
ncbi:MAG: hypothetical protein AAB472_00635 [Patescibacteria group bacterium]